MSATGDGTNKAAIPTVTVGRAPTVALAVPAPAVASASAPSSARPNVVVATRFTPTPPPGAPPSSNTSNGSIFKAIRAAVSKPTPPLTPSPPAVAAALATTSAPHIVVASRSSASNPPPLPSAPPTQPLPTKFVTNEGAPAPQPTVQAIPIVASPPVAASATSPPATANAQPPTQERKKSSSGFFGGVMERMKKTTAYQSMMKKVEEGQKQIEETMHREFIRRRPAPKVVYERFPIEKIGTLTVTVHEGRQLKRKNATFGQNPVNAFCKVLLGDVEKQTEVRPNDVNPEWNESFTFELTDITSDVRVLCYDKERYLGQVIIPLVDMLPSFAPKNAVLPVRDEWYELFPLPPEEKKYRTAVEEMPDTAMKRPLISRGEVRISVQITLAQQLHQAYWMSATTYPPGDDTPSEMSPQYLKGNAWRLKRLMTQPPTWLPFLLHVFGWRDPKLSIGSILYVAYACLAAPYWLWPVLTMIVVISLSAVTRGKRKYGHVMTFADEVWEDPNDPHTKIGLALKVNYILGKIQVFLGIAASFFERLCNLLNWTDERVTMITMAILLAASILLSIFIALLSLFMQATGITLGMVLFAAYLVLMCPPAISPLHIIPLPSKLKAKAPSSSSISQPSPSVSKPSSSASIASATSVDQANGRDSSIAQTVSNGAAPVRLSQSAVEQLEKSADQSEKPVGELEKSGAPNALPAPTVTSAVAEKQADSGEQADKEKDEDDKGKEKESDKDKKPPRRITWFDRIMLVLARIPDDNELAHRIIAREQVHRPDKPLRTRIVRPQIPTIPTADDSKERERAAKLEKELQEKEEKEREKEKERGKDKEKEREGRSSAVVPKSAPSSPSHAHGPSASFTSSASVSVQQHPLSASTTSPTQPPPPVSGRPASVSSFSSETSERSRSRVAAELKGAVEMGSISVPDRRVSRS